MTSPLLPFHVQQRASQVLPQLEAALIGRGWRSAKSLVTELGTNDRVIRQAASQSAGRIISGQRGYCLTREATTREVLHAADWLRSQAKQMTQRAFAIEQAMHGR